MDLTSKKLIVVSLPAAAALALVVTLTPSDFGGPLAEVLEPLLLFAAGLLALWIAPMYRGDMKRAFVCLAVFLVLYSFVFTEYFIDRFYDLTEENFFRALLAYQILTYAFLISACVFILRVIGLGNLSRGGWACVIGAAALGVVIIVRALPTLDDVFAGNSEAGALYLTIRAFDVIVMVALVPVVWLYVSKARDQYQESLTFAVIGGSIIVSLVLAYIYELVKGDSLAEISTSEYQTGSVLDSLYLIGYLLLIAGLVAHRMHQRWSFAQLSKNFA